MPSYFRNLFGGSSNHPTSHSSGNTSSHKRSQSAAPTPKPHASGTTSSSRPVQRQRSSSFSASRAATPSPLRYGTPAPVDTRTAYGYGRSPAAARPATLRRESYEAHPHVQYAGATYAPSNGYSTTTSSRSNSSSSLFGMSSVAYGTRSDAGHRTHYDRPPLRTNQTWHPGSSSSVSSYGSVNGIPFAQPPANKLHMHPVLAHSRLHHAPITYDVLLTPSARTVLDRATHSAIPAHTLAQPATDPPTPSSARLVLRSDRLPWPVVVGPGPSAPNTPNTPRARFTIGPEPRRGRAVSEGAITVLDVLYAVHGVLQTPITPEEWEALGAGSAAQARVTRAYEARCTRMGGGWEGGVRRVDWLADKTSLVGVEVDKSTGSGRLVFARP
ncbi:hypothetical protein CERSUDRAFT_99648 [Gelatoporia subvermispora B]|uniref:DUF6699 domain-containing protein n=1 Tax=Ceriporiopsis subvermispora (strain B) TaxID=914234 RepID=M2R1Y8_CERS8|nr:hypothetical protein CERSUDRAFT_99648 [Gelatoporia subvermispora B]